MRCDENLGVETMAVRPLVFMKMPSRTATVKKERGMRVRAIIEEVFGPIHLQSAAELDENLRLFDIAANLTGAQIDTLYASERLGPLWDGDVPSKTGRDDLVELGLMAQIVHRGEQGYNACTYRGASVARCRRAIRAQQKAEGER